MNTFLPLAFPSRLASARLVFVIFRMSNRSKKYENLNLPLLSELSRSSLDSFESAGKVDQIRGRLHGLIRPKVAFENFRDFPNVESVEYFLLFFEII